MRSQGDLTESLWAVVAGIECREDRKEGLGCADVRGGFFSTDVLLAGLKRQAISSIAMAVDRLADQAPGDRPFERVAGGKKSGVWTAEPQRDAEALRGPNGHIGA